jgi:hypothetical protein
LAAVTLDAELRAAKALRDSRSEAKNHRGRDGVHFGHEPPEAGADLVALLALNDVVACRAVPIWTASLRG